MMRYRRITFLEFVIYGSLEEARRIVIHANGVMMGKRGIMVKLAIKG